MKKFQKSLILASEVIVQPPKHTSNYTFSRVLAHCAMYMYTKGHVREISKIHEAKEGGGGVMCVQKEGKKAKKNRLVYSFIAIYF